MLVDVLTAALVAGTTIGAHSGGAPAASAHSVIELRQYKLTAGAEASFIELFDKEFVDSQEALGIRLIGQFRDHDRKDRFTWIREFPDMQKRGISLPAFYGGPVWAAHRDVANPMLFDNDNVLLLRPADPQSAFSALVPRPKDSAGQKSKKLTITVIQYLWKNPDEGFTRFFLEQVAPRLKAAGLPVLGAYVPEEKPNNFPRLPVRHGEKVFVWFTQAESSGSFDRLTARLRSGKNWQREVAPTLAGFEERPPQVLRLDPTPRSALR